MLSQGLAVAIFNGAVFGMSAPINLPSTMEKGMIPSNHQLSQELKQKQLQLQAFRESTEASLQTLLDQYDWGIVSGGGHQGLPLLTLRLDHRIALDDPFLIRLAEQAEKTWGPIDFALFSGETSEPVKVLSKTLLDQRWRRRQTQA